MSTLIGSNPLIIDKEKMQLIYIKKLKKEIKNIISSYSGSYDVFSELIQNAMDSVDRRNEYIEESIVELENKKNCEEITDRTKETVFYELNMDISDRAKAILELKKINYEKHIYITINADDNRITVTDNGCGFEFDDFKNFLAPNMTNKDKDFSKRGKKGVGATFLAYGFNFIQVGTKNSNYSEILNLEDGRKWVESPKNDENLIPKFKAGNLIDENFNKVQRGATVTVEMGTSGIKPRRIKDLKLTTIEQWIAVLLSKTPLGSLEFGIKNMMKFDIKLIYNEKIEINENLNSKFQYPHEISTIHKKLDISTIEGLSKEEKRLKKNASILYKIYNPSDIEALLTNKYKGDELKYEKRIVKHKEEKEKLERENSTKKRKPKSYKNKLQDIDIAIQDLEIKIRENKEGYEEDKELISQYDIDAYGSFISTKDYFKQYHKTLRLGNTKIFDSGLQIATSNMVQGSLIDLKLSSESLLSNQSYVVVHFDKAEPDLGRKGFHVTITDLARKIGALIISEIKKYKHLYLEPSNLRRVDESLSDIKKTCSKKLLNSDDLFTLGEEFMDELELSNGLGLICLPDNEQEVVALFNQLLGAGIIKGIKLIKCSSSDKYDGIFEYYRPCELDNIFNIVDNPFGVYNILQDGVEYNKIIEDLKVYEYKHTFSNLIAEFANNMKKEEEIDLVIVWDIDAKSREKYNIISTLYTTEEIIDRNGILDLEEDAKVRLNQRLYHGITHVAYARDDSTSKMFDIICLSDLIEFYDDLRIWDNNRTLYEKR